MREIPLTQGFVALVDDEDYEAASSFRWSVHRGTGDLTCYARRRTRSANQRLAKNSTSGFKGVSWRKDIQRWSAHIRAGELFHLGMFDTAEEAARAYDAAALTAWGDFAALNFPRRQTDR